jgi:hypothetical protein
LETGEAYVTCVMQSSLCAKQNASTLIKSSVPPCLCKPVQINAKVGAIVVRRLSFALCLERLKKLGRRVPKLCASGRAKP